MDARICSNPKCRTILPTYTCSLCSGPTEPLPAIPLGLIGVDGQARLIYTRARAYAILITKPSGNQTLKVLLHDLMRCSQPHLPLPNPVTGLMIMDAVNNAATLIRSKNPGHWASWIISLLQALEAHAHPTSFQEVLKDLEQDIRTNILEDPDPPEEA